MKEVKISILNKYKERLVCIKTISSIKKSKYPAVILVHGFHYNKSEDGMFDYIAKSFSSIGMFVFRFDFSGCAESEGDFSETSLSKLVSDLSVVLEFVRSQKMIDNKKIGIIAQSFGTTVTIALKPKIKCLAMLGSVAHPKDTLAQLFGKGYNPDGISVRIKNNKIKTKLKPKFWRDLAKYDLLDSIKSIHSPILFIHGKKDNIVPLSEMETYFDNANEPKKKVIIKDLDHSLLPNRNKVYKLLIDWFKKNLF